MQQLIEELIMIKENDCKTLREMIFFDGILSVIECKDYLGIEKSQLISSHNKANENWEKGYPTPITEGKVYYNETFKQQTP